MGNQLSEKIQVLISKGTLRELNQLILTKALDEGERPEPLSTFVRKLLNREIDEYNKQKNKAQKSYVGKDVKEITGKN